MEVVLFCSRFSISQVINSVNDSGESRFIRLLGANETNGFVVALLPHIAVLGGFIRDEMGLYSFPVLIIRVVFGQRLFQLSNDSFVDKLVLPGHLLLTVISPQCTEDLHKCSDLFV